jgi:hypothetical protein
VDGVALTRGNRFKVLEKFDISVGEKFFACLFSFVIIIIIPTPEMKAPGGVLVYA